MLFGLSSSFKMIAFAVVSVLFATVFVDSELLTTCKLENYTYECVKDQTSEDIYGDQICVEDTCPDRINTTCANMVVGQYCPKGEHCITPFPGFTQAAFDFAKCKPPANVGELCSKEEGNIQREENDKYFLFPPCRLGLICEPASFSKGQFIEFGICREEKVFQFNYPPPKNTERLTTCYLGNYAYDCVKNQKLEDYDSDKFCIYDDCPERIDTTCGNRVDTPNCPEGENCVIPYPHSTQTAADFAKCKPFAKTGEPCGMESDGYGKSYIFPNCDKELKCAPADFSEGQFQSFGICEE